eukprot:TRINITY_DN35672_c0_g1_i1.p1 TRINITY_DN35672_c0_g1~~TRINITY_DN35672_c0_g1_i1.p1  ORF type:complete len:407 (+),score=112.73 TRINITY_DN35672_c0_g1_i1:38-1258(+)
MSDAGSAAASTKDHDEGSSMTPRSQNMLDEVLKRRPDPRVAKPRGEFEKSADFANYFITYGFLYHQKQMLEDEHRMDSYYRAIKHNAATHFKDKVVLDLGTGTGVLAIWAAQAGAKKVYAVEATAMAKHARALVKANGLDHIIEVIQGPVESLPKPEEPADTMVSEWMGYLLLRESMLDSIVWARDNGWCKPDCAMFPSHATVMVAPCHLQETENAVRDLGKEVAGWQGFVERTKGMFNIDLAALRDEYFREQRIYHLQSVQWRDIPAAALVGHHSTILTMDIHTVKVDDYRSFTAPFELMAHASSTATALAGWFEVEFRGNASNPCKVPVRLTTAPSPHGHGTHWGQQCFHLHPPVPLSPGERISGTIQMSRNGYNHRLLDFEVKYRHVRPKGTSEETTSLYVLE